MKGERGMDVFPGPTTAELQQRDTDPMFSAKLCLRRSGHAYCPVCEKLVELIAFDAAAGLFRTDLPDVVHLAERYVLHRVHNRRGELMICSISLFDCFESRETQLLDKSVLDAASQAGAR